MLAGKLSFYLMLTVVVTAIVSPLVVWLYARAVLSGMQRAAGPALEPAPPATPAGPAVGPDAAARRAWERQAHRRVVAAWLGVVVLASLPVAALESLGPDGSISAFDATLRMLVFVLVAVPAVALSLGWPWWRGVWQALLLSCAAAACCLLLSAGSRLARDASPVFMPWAVFSSYYSLVFALLAPALVVVLATAPARIRSVVPMTFSGLVVFGAAPYLAGDLWAAMANTETGTQLMLLGGSVRSRYVIFVLLALPFGALMAWRLHRLARAYAAKRFSDLQLLARMGWLMFVVSQLMLMLSARPGAWWWIVPGCALAVALFGPLQALVFRRANVPRGAPPPATLLLLRVFGFRRRTERLFDRIGARWRYHGPVTMIAAPDVVARTIDPADFLRWLLGRTGEAFVCNADDLRARLGELDLQRDPDGRYRINEFCCADNTWRATVVALMQRTDAVLMDLRGATAQRKGCEYELQQLALRVAPERVVLVVEPGANRAALAEPLGVAAARVRWFELAADAPANDALFDALLAAAAAPARGA